MGMWDVATGVMVSSPRRTRPHRCARWLSFSPDGTLLAADAWGDEADLIVVWDVDSGTEAYRISYGDDRYAWGPSFSPDGAVLAAVDGSEDIAASWRVVLHDAVTGTELGSLDVGDVKPGSTAFDPTGRYLAALDADARQLC